MATQRQRYMISVDDDLFERIEDFRYKNRFPTRSEATAELIRLGLESLAQSKVGEYPDDISALKRRIVTENEEARDA